MTVAMADTVRYHLEQMVPELEDYEKRGLFSRHELKEVVKKRSHFEYAVKRRAPLKEDFLRYVEYEMQLDSLRKIRKAAIVRSMKAANLKWRGSLSDSAITKRIMYIYERALRRFKGDLQLWLKLMEFCRIRGSSRRMQKVVTQALQLHPCTPGLWMYAAAWEFEHNLNEKSARAMMQQGLRMCPKSESLWLEYLRLELAYASKIKARQLLLGSGKEEQSGPEKVVSSGANAKMVGLSLKMTQAIFRNLVTALPQSVSARVRFFELLKEANFIGKEEVMQEVLDSLDRDFPENVECCKLRAWRAVEVRENLGDAREQAEEEAVKVYEGVLARKPTAMLYGAFAEFLEKLIRRDEDPSALDKEKIEHYTSADGVALKWVEKLKGVYERARSEGMLTEVMARREIALLTQEGTEGKIQEACKPSQACSQGAGSFWAQRMALAMQRHNGETATCQGNKEELFQILHEALKTLPLSESLPLWRQLMEAIALETEHMHKLVDLAVSRLALNGRDTGSAALECAIVTWVLQLRGAEDAWNVCKRLLALPSSSLELVRLWGRLEAQAAVAGNDGALSRIRSAFEGGLQAHGATNTALWLDYCRLELQFGGHKEAAALHWRAKKMLKNPSEFLKEYQQLTG